jgi:AraC-like DNA-binding protein/streptogramin lyase
MELRMERSVKVVVAMLPMLLTALLLSAQPLCRVVQYDEEDGVPSNHLTQVLQDERGFLWFSTWNGLCRYDGYDFQTFKTQVGDGCNMKSDRIRNINLLPQGLILCQVDEDYFMFDLCTYRFRDLTDDEHRQIEDYKQQYRQSRSLQNRERFSWTDAHGTQWSLERNGRLTYLNPINNQEVDYPLSMPFNTLTFAVPDKRGNLWVLDSGSIYQFCTDVRRTHRIDITPKAEVKSLYRDSQGRYWVATKDDKAVRVYRCSDNSLIGFLGSDGRLHPQYTTFGAAVYCMYESKDGTLWLGAKPQGLYRLQETSPNEFETARFLDDSHHDIYHLKEDRWGRLWVATLDGGLGYLSGAKSQGPSGKTAWHSGGRFQVPKHYPKEKCTRARYLYINDDDILFVATSNGLMVSQLRQDADEMHFVLHERESERESSLSSSATMDVVEDSRGQVSDSTESGGINLIVSTESEGSNVIESRDLLAERMEFRHFNEIFHAQANDIVQSLTPLDGGSLMAVGSHLITLIDSTYHGRVLDARYFNEDYRFSEAHPIAIDSNRWLFGLTDGAFITDWQKLSTSSSMPQLVLTNVEVRNRGAGDRSLWGAELLDTLTLLPHERSITIHFAALEYVLPDRISYAFRLSDSEDWNYIGHDRSATLLDLAPDTYVLEIRSTNANGEWQDNVRRLTIVVQHTFWESAIGRLLIVVLIIVSVCAIAYTLLYIRRIKRKQRETLEAYLALIEVQESRGQAAKPLGTVETGSKDQAAKPLGTVEAGDTGQVSGSQLQVPGGGRDEADPTLQRVMAFIEANLSNSEVGVGDMAEAAATSRSGLQRKLKQAMGITPQDLMKEARIKRACLLLHTTEKTVAEVAYACGFTDPKYFSRCFKQSTGKSPTEYREG